MRRRRAQRALKTRVARRRATGRAERAAQKPAPVAPAKATREKKG